MAENKDLIHKIAGVGTRMSERERESCFCSCINCIHWSWANVMCRYSQMAIVCLYVLKSRPLEHKCNAPRHFASLPLHLRQFLNKINTIEIEKLQSRPLSAVSASPKMQYQRKPHSVHTWKTKNDILHKPKVSCSKWSCVCVCAIFNINFLCLYPHLHKSFLISRSAGPNGPSYIKCDIWNVNGNDQNSAFVKSQ